LRLTLWYLAIFALAQFAFGTGMWLVLRHHLVSIVDENLRNQTEDLRSFLVLQKKNANVPKFREEVTETYLQEHAGEYLVISTSAGEPIFASDFLMKNGYGPSVVGLPTSPVFEDQILEDRPLRFYRSSINTHGLTFIVAMGASTKDATETLHAFRNYLLLLAPLMLLISGIGGYTLSRRALAPVDTLTRTARTISGQNLSSRLEKLDTGDELQRLSDTLNEMLDRIEKAFLRITQFTGDASHELRTPISLMRTEAEIALRRERDPDAYRDALQHILKETERASVLIEDLLALARADSGKEFLKLQPVEIGDLVRDFVKGWHLLVSSTGHLLTYEASNTGQIWIMADESALRRVLTILIENAVKYTPAPGRIRVSLEDHAGGTILSVRDTGVGIPKVEQPKIFERFYRVDKARGRTLSGAGLGLAIARWIVERHGGTITVESAPNQGSTFYIHMPTISHPSLPRSEGVVQA
jgi:heavy metal sensor kinase